MRAANEGDAGGDGDELGGEGDDELLAFALC